jgi:hypothetical protein
MNHILVEFGAIVALLVFTGWGYVAVRLYLPVTYAVNLTTTNESKHMRLIGFHDVEHNGTIAYRWSKAIAAVPFRYNTNARYTASIRLRAANPASSQPLTFFLNQRELATVTPDNEFRVYRLVLPSATTAEAPLQFGFQTTPFMPEEDQRKLGVMATEIEIAQHPLVEWTTALVIPLAFLVLWLWLRSRGTTAQATLIICLTLSIALLVLYALYRTAPLPYHWLALLTLLASGVGAVLSRDLLSRLCLALLLALMGFGGVIWPSWFSDDAFISFRYAQNLVAGNGLVYNVGERVEGYTNFLWTILAALVLWLGGDPVFWAHVAGVVLGLGIALTTYWLARRLLGPTWALAATLIVATSQSLMVYTARGAGLETGLFALLVLLGSGFYLHAMAEGGQRWLMLTGGSFALATLTRPEGALLMALTIFYALMKDWRFWLMGWRQSNLESKIKYLKSSIVPLLTPYVLVVATFFLWRLWYYGDLLPNTFYAKTGGGLYQIIRGLEYTGAFIMVLGGPLVLAVVAPLAINRRKALRPWWSYLALLVGIYTLYIIAVGGDHFPGERFFVPLIPWLALLMADGLAWIYGWLQQNRLSIRLAPLVLGLVLAGFSWHALSRSAAFDHTLVGNDESIWIWRDLGLWLHDNANPDASIAALGAGAIAYYSDRTTIDLLGLNDKHIARVEVENMGQGIAGHEKRDPEYVLNMRRPTYIPKMWEDYFGGKAVLNQQYQLITITTRSGYELELWKRQP